MKRFLVVQHSYSEFLGNIERQLEKRDIGFAYLRCFLDQQLPGSARDYDALWLLGGAYPTLDREACPWVDDELALIDVFEKAHRPVVGIGFGALLVAQQHGGTPEYEPLHTSHWSVARKTVAGEDDPLANAVDGRKVLVLHNGSVKLPPTIAPLVVDEDGNWLAIRPNDLSYGMLFRPELKPGMIEDMVMEAKRPLPDNVADVLAEARLQWDQTQVVTDRVIAALVSAL
ncbi:MAG: type 1 glutamine amidotransferase, partial [Burkholderiales bacterium]